ncbi:MAG: hypothetical protein PWP31_540 [Clostridia bacterium]|nr:hypothetical protein [Clostridia bacterium]
MLDLNGRFRQLFQTLLIGLMVTILFLLLFYYVLPATSVTINILIPVIAPFLLAALLAAIIDPIVNLIEQRLSLNRGWAVILTLLIVVAILSISLFYLITNLIIELEKLALTLPKQVKLLTIIIQDYLYGLQNFYFAGNLPPDILEALQSLFDNAAVSLKKQLVLTVELLINFISLLPHVFIFVIITFISTYFFSLDKNYIFHTILGVLNPYWQERLSRVSSSVGRAIVGFLRAEILLISLQMTQTIIGFLILKVDYTLTLAFLIGLADLLPVVGPGIVFIPWVIIEFVFGHFGMGLALLILYAFIIILRQVLQPKLVAINIGLHPLTTLVALYAGLKLMGIVGLVLGPLLIVILKAFFNSGQEVTK